MQSFRKKFDELMDRIWLWFNELPIDETPLYVSFSIPRRLPGLNEYTLAGRSNRYAQAAMKQRAQEKVENEIRRQIPHSYFKKCAVFITWYEKDRRRDIDNITFATKFILDALVNQKVIPDDSQKYVTWIIHDVQVDRDNPRIEVHLIEEE